MPDVQPNLAYHGPEEFLTIGSLAQLCGLTVRTLRYYEEIDLIGPVKRTTGKYRLYNKHSQKRVHAIQALQALGYSLEEILVTLGPYSKSREFSKPEQIAATRRSLQQQQTAITDKMQQLEKLKEDIDQRLKVLDAICTPCYEHASEQKCPENCAYIDVHD